MLTHNYSHDRAELRRAIELLEKRIISLEARLSTAEYMLQTVNMKFAVPAQPYTWEVRHPPYTLNISGSWALNTPTP